MRYLTSDTHFQHKNILEFCKRPFANIQEHDEAIITYWNETVNPEDEVYHLGDFAFGIKANIPNIVNKLNGSITLILGNHDQPKYFVGSKIKDIVVKHKRFGQISMLYQHIPSSLPHYDKNSRNTAQPVGLEDIFFHGHVHEEWCSKWIRTPDNFVLFHNVGVDVRNYRPVAEEQLIQEYKKVLVDF